MLSPVAGLTITYSAILLALLINALLLHPAAAALTTTATPSTMRRVSVLRADANPSTPLPPVSTSTGVGASPASTTTSAEKSDETSVRPSTTTSPSPSTTGADDTPFVRPTPASPSPSPSTSSPHAAKNETHHHHHHATPSGNLSSSPLNGNFSVHVAVDLLGNSSSLDVHGNSSSSAGHRNHTGKVSIDMRVVEGIMMGCMSGENLGRSEDGLRCEVVAEVRVHGYGFEHGHRNGTDAGGRHSDVRGRD